MKERIKSTGESINVATIGFKGKRKLSRFEEEGSVITIPDEEQLKKATIHLPSWFEQNEETIRIQAAIAALQGILAHEGASYQQAAVEAVEQAKTLVELLKK